MCFLIIYFLTSTSQVFIPNKVYRPQKLINAVIKKTKAKTKNQGDTKYPKIPDIKPNNILAFLSNLPIFFFITLL